MKTVAQAAAEYRKRRSAKFDRMEAGHRAIIAELGTNDKPLAAKIRQLAEDALA